MATRIVEPNGYDFINKVVNVEHQTIKCFPCISDIVWKTDQARELLEKQLEASPPIERSAIAQQYNEIYIWYENITNQNNELLAPICGISYNEESGMPILTYPRFEPLVNSDSFYRYTYEDGLIKLGYFAAEKNIPLFKVVDFLISARELCESFNLNADDIIGNLSNIGWHETFGLRIIDYGLKEGGIHELVF